MQDHVIASLIGSMREQLVLNDFTVEFVSFGYWLSPFSEPHWHCRISIDGKYAVDVKADTAGECLSLARDAVDAKCSELANLAAVLGITEAA